jgi:Concanavalin A-like lectin/glucanases superfamily
MNARRRASMTIATCLAVWGGVVLGETAVRAGLVAYYPFEGTANEATGNNTNLSLFGNAGFGPSVSPGLGQALALDGDGDAAIGQNFQKIAGNSMSAVAWVYANDVDGDWDTIVKNWGVSFGGQFHLGLGTNLEDNLQNYLGNGTNAKDGALPLQQWVHVAFVADAAALQHRLYMNGVEVANVAYSGTLTKGSATGLGIGAKPNDDGSAPAAVDNAAGFWSGSIDDVALFDQALTANQIAQIYNAGLAGTPVGALGVPEPSSLALALVVAMALGSRCLALCWKRSSV